MRKGIIFGTFDLLTAGHVHLLKQCKLKCDYLIVGLQVDPSIERKRKHKPVESFLERGIKLQAIKYVNQIVPYEREKDIEVILKFYKPNRRFLGSDYKGTKKHVSFPDLVQIEYIDSLPIHTSDIRRRL